jgi:hypothetical protein
MHPLSLHGEDGVNSVGIGHGYVTSNAVRE